MFSFLVEHGRICYPPSWLCGCLSSVYALQCAAAIATADVPVFVSVRLGCQKPFVIIIRAGHKHVRICVLSVRLCGAVRAWLLIGYQSHAFYSEMKSPSAPGKFPQRKTRFQFNFKKSTHFNIEKENTV